MVVQGRRSRDLVKLIDFGLAIKTRDAECGETCSGAPGYIAPEHLQGEASTEAGDLYGVGSCLYEMLTGERAFRGQGDTDTLSMQLFSDLVPPRELRPEIPVRLERLVLRTMSRAPEGRPTGAWDMRLELDALMCELRASVAEVAPVCGPVLDGRRYGAFGPPDAPLVLR